MPFAFVQSASNSIDVAGTTITVALTGVAAGNLIALWVKHEGAATTITASDGTDTFTGATKEDHANGDLSGRFLYLLASSAGNKTYTATFGASVPYSRIHVYEYSYTGTPSLDVQNTAEGSSTAPNSGNFTTTGTDEVCFGGNGEYISQVATSPLINGLAADGSIINSPVNSHTASWRRVFTSTFTGAASITTFKNHLIFFCISFKP